MNEAEFLKSYDAAAFEPYAVTVDLVLISIIDDQLVTLVKRRTQHPEIGKWALPGGFVGTNENLDEAALRVLRAKTSLDDIWLEQLYSFGNPKRDPRMRVISVAYFALLPDHVVEDALKRDPDLKLARILTQDLTDANDCAALQIEGKGKVETAFDHAEMLGVAVKRLRGKLNYTPIALSLLPERFTLRALQTIHETILDTSFNKPAFRRRMLDSGMIEGTGEREPAGGAYRPAELYHRKPQT